MTRAIPITILLAFGLSFSAAPAHAFTECIPRPNANTGGHWPNPNNTAQFGTQKWEFDWRITPNEGLEISNVRYTSDLSQPKKLVIKRASIPFLPVHYPQNPPMCDAGIVRGWNDTFGSAGDPDTREPICCAHVPTTPCNLPARTLMCVPHFHSLMSSDCDGGGTLCNGVCEGTQVDMSPPIEDGVGEVISGAPDADVVLTAGFFVGYQFIQRWRFRDDGTLLASLRAGGLYDCNWHNHQIYWRMHFQLADNPNDTVQECGSGRCPDLGTIGWTPVTGCGVGTTTSASWRIADSAVADRAIVVERGPNDGDPRTFCEGTSLECGQGGCKNTHDFCALAAKEPNEMFMTDKCDDQLANRPSASPDMAFWYMAHVDHHDPCHYLPMCDPDIGDVAFGPTIRLVGNGW